MESSRVMCPHCDFLFYPEEGVSLDDCPKCGRTVEVKPDHIADANKKVQPAPALPGDDGEICARLLSACTGHPHALIPWPHRLLHDAVSHISDLTRRLAEAEQIRSERDALRERCERLARILKHSQDVFDAIDMTGLCPLCQGDEDHNSGCPMRAVEEEIQAALSAKEATA